MPGELRTKLPEIHDAGGKAQELMKEFFLFNLIWVPEDFSLRDGDSLLDVFVAHAYPAILLFTALGVLLWLLPGYGRMDATW